jgi:hypothetical protein
MQAPLNNALKFGESGGKNRKQEPLLEAASAGLAAPAFKARKRHAALFAFWRASAGSSMPLGYAAPMPL